MGPEAQVQAASLAAWGMEKRGEEQKGRRGQREDGEGISVVTPPRPAPGGIPLSPGPEAPQQLAQVGGQRRSRHRHLGAHQEESREGRKERRLVGGSKGGRQAGGRRRREGGEREGQRETLKQRTEELGLARGAGKGREIEGVRRYLGSGPGARW